MRQAAERLLGYGIHRGYHEQSTAETCKEGKFYDDGARGRGDIRRKTRMCELQGPAKAWKGDK